MVVTKGGIIGSIHIRTLADVEDLIAAINAWKILLIPMDEITKPAWADRKFKPGDVVPASTPFHAHHLGHAGEVLFEPEEGDTFPRCDECGDGVRYTLA